MYVNCVDINELHISEDHQEEVGGDDDDLEEGALLGEEHQWLTAVLQLRLTTFVNSEKHPLGAGRVIFWSSLGVWWNSFWAWRTVLKQFGSLVGQFRELGGPED